MAFTVEYHCWNVYKLSLSLGGGSVGKMFMTRAFEPEFRLPEQNLCKAVEIVAHSFNTLEPAGPSVTLHQ